MKRAFDILASSSVLVLFSPFWLIISLAILLDSKGGIFFRQQRVGRHGELFWLYKFRTMRPESEKKGQLTVGKDKRITKVGEFLRKYKLDEIPQLLNIIKGEMSVVGPRPEVPKYVALYTEEQRKVLQMRPGLTDYASLEYINEAEILGRSDNPERTYIEELMPRKLELNLKYIADFEGIQTDLKLIFNTIAKIVRNR